MYGGSLVPYYFCVNFFLNSHTHNNLSKTHFHKPCGPNQGGSSFVAETWPLQFLVRVDGPDMKYLPFQFVDPYVLTQKSLGIRIFQRPKAACHPRGNGERQAYYSVLFFLQLLTTTFIVSLTFPHL